MNREETFELFAQGKEAWNAWAREMLTERKRLEEEGKWSIEENWSLKKDWDRELYAQNDETVLWMAEAVADFSTEELPYTFENDMSFAGFNFPWQAHFFNGIFYKKVDFDAAEFSECANFENSKFFGDTNFNAAKFSEDAVFCGAKFIKAATFTNAEFGSDTDFCQAEFSVSANFQKAQFSGDAYFSDAKFHGDVVFKETNLSEDADFYLAKFTGKADFKKTQFGKRAYLYSAKFDGDTVSKHPKFSVDAKFYATELSGSIVFYNAKFCGNADFEGAKFSGYADFDFARFRKHANFKNAKLSGEAKFKIAQFDENAIFKDVLFSGYADFRSAKFIEEAAFEIAKFEGPVRFNPAGASYDKELAEADGQKRADDDLRDTGPVIFYQTVEFNEATFNSYVTFERAKFHNRANFNAIHTERGFTLADAQFHRVPDFIQAHFKEAPRLDNVKVQPLRIKTKGYLELLRNQWSRLCNKFWPRDEREELSLNIYRDLKDIPARWRALKRIASQAHDREREQMFSPMEIRSARFVSDWPLPYPIHTYAGWHGFVRFWFGFAYGFTSKYGHSIALPLIWLAVCTIGFAAYYLGESRSISDVPREPYHARFVEVAAHPIPEGWIKVAHAPTPCAEIKDDKDTLEPLEKRIADSTNAVSEALYLAIANASVLGGIGAPESARRTYGCLFGLVKDEGKNFTPIVPPSVSRWSLLQKFLSLILIFLLGLAVRNMLKMK